MITVRLKTYKPLDNEPKTWQALYRVYSDRIAKIHSDVLRELISQITGHCQQLKADDFIECI